MAVFNIGGMSLATPSVRVPGTGTVVGVAVEAVVLVASETELMLLEIIMGLTLQLTLVLEVLALTKLPTMVEMAVLEELLYLGVLNPFDIITI